MIDPQFLASQSIQALDRQPDPELNQRLGLYQVFLRLYEQNRGLLDEILNLEMSGARSLRGSMFPFVQGMVLGQRAYIITNLVGSRSQTFAQPQHVWTIGRDSRRVNVPIRDRRLSRYHASIEYIAQEGFYLRDLGSSNGSFVNGELLRQHRLLADGDQVRLGSLTFTFFVTQEIQQLSELSPDVLTQVSLADTPPTMPLDPEYQDAYQDAEDVWASQEDEARDSTALGSEDTSMFMRRHP
ncbi:MAG: FHA domain-containing protein [Leptolyngbya sp. DLM2.Bin15]|nr:MAG: FHA domain-containing protein [Leptolyngbya sp. DLM2.Bin15]